MVSAQSVRKLGVGSREKRSTSLSFFAFGASTLLVAVLASPLDAWAATGGPQDCTAGKTCTIGEFLYDDASAPITTATCTLTSRDPSGALYLNAQAMTSATDGWYSYEFTAPSGTGNYRSQVCCTVSGDLLCIDKSFEVVGGTDSSSDIASAVWGHSERTLTSFGTLTRDIWLNSTRTLSNLITGSSDSTTDTDAVDVSGLEKLVKENRLLLEELVNEPIIEHSLEDDSIPDLSEKLKNSKSVSSHLFANYQFVQSRTNFLSSKWNSLPESELLDSVIELSDLVGEETDSNTTNSIFGQVNWLKDSWDWEEADAAFAQTRSIAKTLTAVKRQLGSSGKSRYSLLEMRSLASNMNTLEKLIGDSSNNSTHQTLFGRLKQVQAIAKVLDERRGEVDKLLANWDEEKDNGVQIKIDSLLRKVLAINKLPKVNSVLTAKSDKPREVQQQNKLLGMGAVIDANKILLASGSGKSISNTWLEVGSIIFRSLMTNPSTLISQEVPLKYYLPPEVQEEYVIETSDGLEVKYDAERGQYFVEGTYNLKAGETKTVEVKVEDIWIITDEHIESLKNQTAELFRPLEKTSFFAQGVTLKSDIDVSLDKVVELMKKGITPEAKIRAHREAQIELAAVTEKISKLEDLLSQAAQAGSFFGFVGGAQTLAVWGLIIIMITGFVFLVIYMRTLGVNDAKKKTGKGKKKKTRKKIKDDDFGLPTRPAISPYAFIRAAMPFVLVAIISATVSGVIASRIALSSLDNKETEMSLETSPSLSESNAENNEEVLAVTNEADDEARGGEEIVKVVVPLSSKVNIRDLPHIEGQIISRFNATTEVRKIDEEESWVNIVFEDEDALDGFSEGWVHEDFVEIGEEQEDDFTYPDEVDLDTYDSFKNDSLSEVGGPSNSLTGEVVVIDETSTGWLRVREEPWGEEITKVYSGDSFSLVEDRGNWLQIELDPLTDSGQSEGWVFADYTSIE